MLCLQSSTALNKVDLRSLVKYKDEKTYLGQLNNYVSVETLLPSSDNLDDKCCDSFPVSIIKACFAILMWHTYLMTIMYCLFETTAEKSYLMIDLLFINDSVRA